MFHRCICLAQQLISASFGRSSLQTANPLVCRSSELYNLQSSCYSSSSNSSTIDAGCTQSYIKPRRNIFLLAKPSMSIRFVYIYSLTLSLLATLCLSPSVLLSIFISFLLFQPSLSFLRIFFVIDFWNGKLRVWVEIYSNFSTWNLLLQLFWKIEHTARLLREVYVSDYLDKSFGIFKYLNFSTMKFMIYFFAF